MTVAVVAVAAVLVLLGMQWQVAARWMLRLMVPAALVVAAAWVIGTLKEH